MKKSFIWLTVLAVAALFASASLGGYATSPAVAWRYGDADEDFDITSTDARLVLQYAVGKADDDEDGPDLYYDVDNDKKITTTDARLILQAAVGKLNYSRVGARDHYEYVTEENGVVTDIIKTAPECSLFEGVRP